MSAAARAGTAGLLLALAGGARPARAESEFRRNLHKAELRREASERVEFYGRALDSWRSGDGDTLRAHCRFRRGEALVELYEFAKAETDLSAALKADQYNARARFLRGRARLALGRAGEAAKDLEAYAASEPADIEGWLALGDAGRKAGSTGPALEAYRRAETLAPKDHRPLLGRARVWKDQDRCAEAAELLDQADDLAGGRSPEVLTEKGACLFVTGWGKPAQGLKAYGKAITLYERRLDDLQRSRAPAGRLLEEQGAASEPYFGRGRLYDFLEKREEAVADYAQACRLGHRKACARAEELSARAAVAVPKPKPKVKEPEPEPKPKPVKRKKIKIRFNDDPGQRIYGS